MKKFEFEIAKADKGYKTYDYQQEKVRYIPYEQIAQDPKLMKKLLIKQQHKFTQLWNNSAIAEEVLLNLVEAAKKAGIEVTAINELCANTFNLKRKVKDESNDKKAKLNSG